MLELLTQLVLAGLLAMTIFWCVMVHRRLARLRGDQSEMRELIVALTDATGLAERAIADMRRATLQGERSAREQQAKVERQAQALRQLLARASMVALKLGGAIERPEATGPATGPVTGPATGPATGLSAGPATGPSRRDGAVTGGMHRPTAITGSSPRAAVRQSVLPPNPNLPAPNLAASGPQGPRRAARAASAIPAGVPAGVPAGQSPASAGDGHATRATPASIARQELLAALDRLG